MKNAGADMDKHKYPNRNRTSISANLHVVHHSHGDTAKSNYEEFRQWEVQAETTEVCK